MCSVVEEGCFIRNIKQSHHIAELADQLVVNVCLTDVKYSIVINGGCDTRPQRHQDVQKVVGVFFESLKEI